MINLDADVAVIGAGPAGLAAAISAHENGAKNVIVIDRNSWIGGILPQCIHDGFGVEETGTSMTGPEYAEMYINAAKKHGITFMNETMVLQFDKNRKITAVNKKGLHEINAKSIVPSSGTIYFLLISLMCFLTSITNCFFARFRSSSVFPRCICWYCSIGNFESMQSNPASVLSTASTFTPDLKLYCR